MKYPHEQQHPHPHIIIIIKTRTEIPNAMYYLPEISITCFYFISLELSNVILFGPPLEITKMAENNGTKNAIKFLTFEISSSTHFKVYFFVITFKFRFYVYFESNCSYLDKK